MTRALVVFALVAAGCSQGHSPATVEADARSRLGVPDDAKRVIVFAQSSHLDIDWQRTFDDYYRTWVEQILLQARQILDEQPRASFSIAEMAYLQHHLAVHPEERAAWQRHAARGAVRIVGGGMTSPDTLLPETELLVRDYLDGTRLADQLLSVTPHAAWLPDSFGHGASAPDLLAAASFDSVGFARIDGGHTFFENLTAGATLPPRPGSTAEKLLAAGSADFVWRGAGGAELLAHYLPVGLYCQGDNIDYNEDVQLPGAHIGVYDGDQPEFTDARIDQYVSELEPWSRTPYLFVPVGCDFQAPKADLGRYLDGYNRRRYPTTHVWAVAASFEDYAALVGSYRAELPTIDGELSPYFMGFYGSRPALKRAIRDATATLATAEAFATALPDFAGVAGTLSDNFALLARSDHHDFVTGTSADAVVSGEQLPLVSTVKSAATRALSTVAQAILARIPRAPGAAVRLLALNASSATRDAVVDVPLSLVGAPSAMVDGEPVDIEMPAPGLARLALAEMPPWSWRAIDVYPGGAAPEPRVTVTLLDDQGDEPASEADVARVILANERVRAEWRRGGPFTLTSLTIDGVEAIAASSFTLGSYDDDGGLWRLGHEMNGCAFTARPASDAVDKVSIIEATALRVRVAFTGPDGTRQAWLDAGDAGLQLALTAAAPAGTTRTASFVLTGDGSLPRTGLAAGYAERPAGRIFSPTFWPAVDWIGVGPWALLLRQSTGARLDADGTIELMTVRNAGAEKCENLGGSGSDGDAHLIEWRIEAAPSSAAAAIAAQAYDRPIAVVTATGAAADVTDLPAQSALLGVAGDGLVTALKPAERGDGIILRALALPGPVTVTLPPALAARTAVRVDAVERDQETLGPAGDLLTLDASHGVLPTVRLRAAAPDASPSAP